MTSFAHNFRQPYLVARGLDKPGTNRGFFGHTVSVQRLPTEPIGTTTVAFDGVHAGSEIRVQLHDSSEAAGVETCDDNHALTWSVYASGSANNTVRIVIVHPDYKIKEFSYTSLVGAQSIPVQQEHDKWYSNPA